jgi:hypothetical protein
MRFLLALLFTLTATAAWADKFDKYVDPTLAMLTDYIFDYGIVKLEKSEDVLEYLQLKDCTMYGMAKDDIFMQQQMLQQLSTGQGKRTDSLNKNLMLRVPGKLPVKKYNFNTQSFDINPKYQIQNVSMVDVLSHVRMGCGHGDTNYLKKFVGYYTARLNFPISMMRIPLQKATAQGIFDTLDTDRDNIGYKMFYTYVYLNIEGALPEIDRSSYEKRIILLGQVQAIDIFTDVYRTKRLKRLDYSSTY